MHAETYAATRAGKDRNECIHYAATHMNTQTHTPTNNHTVVSLLLIFLTAVAFMHFQVIIGCLQPPHIMELCITSLLSFSSQEGMWMHPIECVCRDKAIFKNENSQKCTRSGMYMHLVPVQQNKPSLNLNWEDLQPERSVINVKHILYIKFIGCYNKWSFLWIIRHKKNWFYPVCQQDSLIVRSLSTEKPSASSLSKL